MTNTNEQTPEEQKRPESELTPVAITLQAITETDQRHYAPLHIALPNESEGTNGSARPGTSRATNTPKLPVGYISTLKGSFTTGTPSPSKEITLWRTLGISRHCPLRTNHSLAKQTLASTKVLAVTGRQIVTTCHARMRRLHR